MYTVLIALFASTVFVWLGICFVVVYVADNPTLWGWRGNSAWLATLVPLFALVVVAFHMGRSFG